MIYPELIDIEEYLQNRSIPYDPPGSKNVGRNSVGIACPFCGDHQHSGNNHLGIKLDTKQWNCWICGAGRNKGFLSLVAKLENCSYQQAKEILQPFMHSDMSLVQTANRDDIRALQGQFKLPDEAIKELLPLHKNYLGKRNFDPEFIFKYYNLYSVGNISKRWKFRLIVPIYFHFRMVSFIGADVTRQHSLKYKNCQPEESLIPINSTVYNFDRAKHTVIVVEGITDVWRIGNGAVALYTKHATRQQLKILSEFERIFIMLDSDAITAAEELANNLAGFTETEIIELDEGDPADMKEEDVKHLRREIFGK
jgi:hypothetical protein